MSPWALALVVRYSRKKLTWYWSMSLFFVAVFIWSSSWPGLLSCVLTRKQYCRHRYQTYINFAIYHLRNWS
jgi:hypothetical protein